MRKMFTAKATADKFIIFHTVAKDGQEFRHGLKSPEFYFSLEKLLQAIKTGQQVIDSDLLNFCNIFCKKNTMIIQFTWLKQGANQACRAWQEIIYLQLHPFVSWLTDGTKGVYRTLDQNNEGKSNRLIFNGSAQQILRNILSKPIIRRKFLKALQSEFMRNSMGHVIEFYSDYDKYSFFWQEKRANGDSYMHGGLIFHRDRSDYDNLEKAKYSIHT